MVAKESTEEECSGFWGVDEVICALVGTRNI
jgi:hypothetical protein